MSLSREAHEVAFQKTCEEKGLQYVQDGQYCVIPSESRCNQRANELASSDDPTEQAMGTKWMIFPDAPNGGVCVEYNKGLEQVCNEYSQKYPGASQFVLGSLYCDYTGGACFPKGYDPYRNDPAFPYSDSATEEEGNNIRKNLATCRIYSKACRGQSYKDGDITSDGEPLGDCYRTLGQQIAGQLLGSDTIYGRFKDTGEEMVRQCGKDWASASCWNSVGDMLNKSVVGVTTKTGKVYATKTATQVFDSIRAFGANPSSSNAASMYRNLSTMAPKKKVMEFMGNMVDDLVGNLGGNKVIPPGLISYLVYLKFGAANWQMAVLMELMGVASRGAIEFSNYLAQKGVTDWLGKVFGGLGKVFGVDTTEKQLTIPWGNLQILPS